MFVVGVVGAPTVGEPSKAGINDAVVAGGATTFPLLRLTAPKADVTVDSEVAEVVPGVAEAAWPPTVEVKFAYPLTIDGGAPFDLVVAPANESENNQIEETAQRGKYS